MFSNRILTQRDMCLKWKKNISQRKTSLLFNIRVSSVSPPLELTEHSTEKTCGVLGTQQQNTIFSPIPHYSIVVYATDDSLPLTVVDTFFHTEWKMWTLMITIMRPKPEDSHSCQVIAIDCVWFPTSHFTSSCTKRSPGAVTCVVFELRARWEEKRTEKLDGLFSSSARVDMTSDLALWLTPFSGERE